MNELLLNIKSINFEAEQFRTALSKYRSSIHAIDESLCIKLYQIVSEIDNFLESNPKEIIFSHTDKTLTTTTLRKSGIRKTFICKRCDDRAIGSTIHEVFGHIKTLNHDDEQKCVKKESARNISRKAKLKNKNLPKKVKALLQKNYEHFFTENLAVAQKLQSMPDYNEIESEILQKIGPAFPDQSIKLYLFGSRLSGIGTAHSDLDIFVDIGEVFNTFENRPSIETKKKLQTVQKILGADAKWSNLIAIENARVPILKILYKPKYMNCDIGFSSSLGYCNTNLTKYLLEVQPIAKALAIFMKKWIQRSKLSEHITTYSTVLLVVLFLQMRKLLPSIKTLQDGLEDQPHIGPWLAVFAEKSLNHLNIPKIPYTLENFKNELIAFFKFYNTVEFKQQLLCPYLGEVISVNVLESPTLIARYAKYIEDEKDNKDAPINITHMNLQDPFQLNHNVTKSVPLRVVLLMKQYFELSLKVLENE